MNHQLLLQTDKPIRVGLIGTGEFGCSFLFQAQQIRSLTVVAVCDRDIDAAFRAARHSGIGAEEITLSMSPAEAVEQIGSGRMVILDDGVAMAELPLDVIVEATGSPESGARNALASIHAGKHVVMVSKETACVVGPILAHKAKEAGVVYTTGDGDQPSLCIGLIAWAQSIGLEVVCAGKAAESDFVYHADVGIVTNGRQQVQVTQSGPWPLWSTPDCNLRTTVGERVQALAGLPQASVADYAEMAIVMNNTGIGYDQTALHAPVARLREVPDLMRHVDDGGILYSTPVIDTINCLRRPDDAGFGGGVFVVVKCHDREAWAMLRAKGHLLSQDGTHAMIYLPHHLLGVETATSVLSAALLGLPTGSDDIFPVAEVVMRTTKPLKAGQRLAMDRGHAIDGIQTAFSGPQRIAPKNAIPYYLAAENELLVDVEAGVLLTYDLFREPDDSAIWPLKQAQDELFLSPHGRTHEARAATISPR